MAMLVEGEPMRSTERAAFSGVLSLITLALAAPALAQVPIVVATTPAEDTAAAVADPNWSAPRTSWGHPSLEGIYSTDDMRSVPRDRPEEMGTRERLTPEEFAKRAQSDAEERDRVLNKSSYSSNSVGSRTFGWTSQIIDPPNGRLPALNDTGQARVRPSDRGSYGAGPFDTFEDFHLYDRCITRGVLGSSFAVIYGNGIRVAQSPDSVVISYEMLADSRVIPLDGRPATQDDVKLYVGNARGHWEGDTIETKNFNGKTSIGGNGIGVRHSDQMTLTERLTRVDPDMIEYRATVDDPLTYTSPFTVRMMWTTQPGYEIFEYSCHEANRAISGGLGGERNYEERVREAQAKGLPVPERLPSQPNLSPLPTEDSAFININREEHEVR
jgi:hypothetical protein